MMAFRRDSRPAWRGSALPAASCHWPPRPSAPTTDSSSGRYDANERATPGVSNRGTRELVPVRETLAMSTYGSDASPRTLLEVVHPVMWHHLASDEQHERRRPAGASPGPPGESRRRWSGAGKWRLRGPPLSLSTGGRLDASPHSRIIRITSCGGRSRRLRCSPIPLSSKGGHKRVIRPSIYTDRSLTAAARLRPR